MTCVWLSTTAYRSWFSSTTWGLGIALRSVGLAVSAFDPLSCLGGPEVIFKGCYQCLLQRQEKKTKFLLNL